MTPSSRTKVPPIVVPSSCQIAKPATPLVALGDMAALTKRYVMHYWRVPQLLAFSIVQPIMFVLLFRYVFGGAINVPGTRYVDYLMPGIFVQVAMFGGAATSIGLAYDLKGGIIDRFRTLPMARSAVLVGRTTADLVRNIMVLAIMIVVGTLIGFRFHTNGLNIIIGLLLILAFGYSFSWMFAAIGLWVKDPETAQTAGFLPLFPFVFASSAFVPVASMPGWLQWWATRQPVSLAVNSGRALFNNLPAWHYIWQLMIWIVGICVVFIPLAVRAYRRIQ